MTVDRSSPFAPWDGVVFDLDGTLVELEVDWPAIEVDLADALSDQAIHGDGASSWELLATAREAGIRDRAESVLGPAEITGATRSTRLPLANILTEIPIPVAVCSLNCEAACRTALRVHDLDGAVDAVVGRDTLAVWKPNPKPLLASLECIEVDPRAGVFVGDSERDRLTARRAGVEFRWVEDATAAVC